MSIGKNIARLRKEKGMTQAELGERLGVSNQAISKWEQEMTMPDVMILPDIAKIFNVPIENLYFYDAKVEEITDKISNKIVKNNDGRVLAVFVEDNDSVVKTRVPIEAIQTLLANENVRAEINFEDEEFNWICDVLETSKGDIVNVCKGEKKTRITIENYEA